MSDPDGSWDQLIAGMACADNGIGDDITDMPRDEVETFLFNRRMSDHEQAIAQGRLTKITGMSQDERRNSLWGDDK